MLEGFRLGNKMQAVREFKYYKIRILELCNTDGRQHAKSFETQVKQ